MNFIFLRQEYWERKHTVEFCLLIANLIIFFTVEFIYFTDSLNDARSKLPTALLKSDLSSAEDIVMNRSKKYKFKSLSPGHIYDKKQNETGILEPKNCPPRYSPELKSFPPRYTHPDDVHKSIHFLI